jgi:hypothetical protein
VSIKNKLVTAVTTAGLLAGLFGSAFVPSVRAAVGDLITVAAGKTNTAGTEAADIKALTGTKVVVDFGKDKTSIPATLTSAANTDDFAFTLSGPCYFGAVAADADASATLYASIATPTSKTLSAVTYDNVTSPKTLELNIEVYSSGAGSCTVVASENGVASGDIVIAFSSNPGVFVATASNWDDATYWQAVTNAYLTVDVDTAVFAALATNDVAVLTVSGAEIISVTESGTTATRTGSVLRYKNAAAATDVDPTLILKMPASAGTVTLTLENQTAEWSMSRSITVIGAALADVPSATYSTVVHSKTASTTTDDTSPVPANGATTLSATVLDGNGNALATQAVITATVSDAAVAVITATETASAATSTMTGTAFETSASGVAKFKLFWMKAGTVTVTVKAGTNTLATKTITFAGSAATITWGTVKSVLTTNAVAIGKITVKDAAGAVVENAAVTVKGDLTYVSTVSASGNTDSLGQSTITAQCVASTYGTGSVTVTVGSITSTQAITCSKTTLHTWSMAFDKTAVGLGGTAVLTITGYDVDGRLIAEGVVLDGAGITATAPTGFTTATAPAAGNAFSNGKLTYTYNAATVEGTYTYSMLKTTAAGDLSTLKTATITVAKEAVAGTLTVGSKKRIATADFGASAASKKIAFVLESASGATKTYYRKANASGVAKYTIVLRGTWTVYASYGDSITDTGTMRR